MIRTIFIFIILISFTTESGSQGFNWQYSPRLPFDYPYIFIGITGSANYLVHDGFISLYERVRPEQSQVSECCNFSSGMGVGTTFGLKGEYWTQSGMTAFSASLSYSSYPGKFTSSGERAITIIDTIQFENELDASLAYLILNIGGRQRLFNSHFTVGAFLEFGILLSDKFIQKERVTSPNWYTYKDGSQERTIVEGRMTEINPLILTPGISFSYDLPVGLGLYASPNINFHFPLINSAKSADWQVWNISLGISIFRGIISKP